MNLADAMARLPEPPDGKPPHWDVWRHDLWKRAQTEPPENFVNWPCIRHTMLVEHWRGQMQARWERLPPRYREVVDRLPPGPLRENAIEQAFHLFQWELETGLSATSLYEIGEFGGGYGAMCWILRHLGYKGLYFIQDFPEFRLLQKWWLEQEGIWDCEGTIKDRHLFIGCYSVSEIPPAEREAVLDGYEHYLIVFSAEFDKWNNEKWFKKWGRGKCLVKKMFDRPDWYALC